MDLSHFMQRHGRFAGSYAQDRKFCIDCFMRKALPTVDYSGMSQDHRPGYINQQGTVRFRADRPLTATLVRKVDSVAEYAARLVSLRRVDVDSPDDAEFVREPADVGSPRLLRQRHLNPAAFSKCVEDLGKAGFISADQYDSHVVADFSRVVRVAIRCDNDSALGLKSRISDAILGTRRLDLALLIHGLQVEIAAQRCAIKLHGLASPTLKVHVWTKLDLHVTSYGFHSS